jgi:pseudouridylate synthase
MRHERAQVEGIVKEGGAVPATIALLDGRIHVGLEQAELERLGECLAHLPHPLPLPAAPRRTLSRLLP